MRILTWNINGIGTLPKYHPWNSLKTFEAILDELSADIVCLQEMKTSRKGLNAQTAVPGKYDGFFSFPMAKGGYSGVAVYTNSNLLIPVKAEEGLSGCVQPKPPFSANERISATYPSIEDVDLMADDEGIIPNSLLDFDKEGRALVVDFGMFVLINLYCVADSADIRYHYKMNFYYLLQERVRLLINEGREVIVVGDLNACPFPIDHVEGRMPGQKETFHDHPHRAWIRDWISPRGPLIDIVRELWPTREGMFTCEQRVLCILPYLMVYIGWNTKTSARDGNYGTRIDLILITPGLRKWVKQADIQPTVRGSDHCPVFLDLHESIHDADGRELRLSDALQGSKADLMSQRILPRICAKNWDEYSAKQTKLSSFFIARTASAAAPSNSPPKVSPLQGAPSSVNVVEIENTPEPSLPPPPEGTGLAVERADTGGVASSASQKRKRGVEDSGQMKRAKVEKPRGGQAKLSSFFQKPKAIASGGGDAEEMRQEVKSVEEEQYDRDIEMAIKLSQCDDGIPSPGPVKETKAHNKQAWSALLAPVRPPSCTVHGEATKMYTVNKPGPTKGKTFFLCSRPLGPGYDMGKAKRPRSEVDAAYRCDFFKWSADVRLEQQQEQEQEQGQRRDR